MIVKDVKSWFVEELSGEYPSEEIQSFFTLLSEYFLNYSRLETVLKAEEPIPEAQLKNFEVAVQQLQKHTPIQYIIGETEFYGLPFKVNPHTLIPRPETEELVDWIVNDEISSPHKNRKILDIGTGSGCIAISLAKHLPKHQVFALDFSGEALAVAIENSLRNKAEVQFFEDDILNTNSLHGSYDIIVSNPPYVREQEKLKMRPNVLNHEPGSALFVSDDDPLIFYKKIAQLASQYLSNEGLLYFEINEYLSSEMRELLLRLGFSEIEIRKDIFGKDRMIRCKKTNQFGTTP
ncbi:MAG: peptide chain release factor N(5)-glutamine methyltransferase [Bacteroidota bacterium]